MFVLEVAAKIVPQSLLSFVSKATFEQQIFGAIIVDINDRFNTMQSQCWSEVIFATTRKRWRHSPANDRSHLPEIDRVH
jgi:hypothetical protein